MKEYFVLRRVSVPNLYAVVVLYNSLLSEAKILKTLNTLNCKELNLIVVDNSDRKEIQLKNKNFSTENNIILVNMNGNKGLSKAYNKVLELLKGRIGYVVWLDDDTEISIEYLTKLLYASRGNYDIILPIIQDTHGKIVSPNSRGLLSNKPIKSYKDGKKLEKFNAINSCTAVNLDIYEEYRYDERLFLDEIDHSFFYDHRNKNLKIELINTIVIQNFSQRADNLNFDTAWSRLKIRIRDLIVAYKIRGGIFMGLVAVLKSILLGLQLYLKIKDLRIVIYSFTSAVCIFLERLENEDFIFYE